MLRVRMEALVRIRTDFSHIRQTECAQRHEPLVQKIMHQSLTQKHFAGLVEPHLHYIENEQYAGQFSEDTQLPDERGHILVGQRVVERSVPSIELDLFVGRRPHDRDECRRQHQEFVALARGPESRDHLHEFGEKAIPGKKIAACVALSWFA